MWARRLGVPHLWPSRVKVFFLGVLTSFFIFSVFQYLHNANVEYLDLTSPTFLEVGCKLPRPECRHSVDPVACTVLSEDRNFWSGLNLSTPCPTVPTSVKGATCRNPSLPLISIMGDLGSLHTVNSGVNPFKLWSVLFLVLTSLLCVSILIHDLALLEDRLRPTILSIPKMRYAVPRLWDFLGFFQCRRRMRWLWQRSRIAWVLFIPFWGIFQAIAFMAVMYPFSLLVCFFAPVRMSRILVFLSGILVMLWSIVFVLVTVLFDRKTYSVLWGVAAESKQANACVCFCEYPLSQSVVLRIVALGVGMCWHSLSLTLRALKGLRRGQWANMFSVLHAVPIEAYPVRWGSPPVDASSLGVSLTSQRQDNTSDPVPGSKPIKWRSEGEAVQSEPAFDPFCLMDEQPESAWTRALIVPVCMASKNGPGDSAELVEAEQQQHFLWEPYTGNLDTEIGCCGFPLPPTATRGHHQVDDDMEGKEDGNFDRSDSAEAAWSSAAPIDGSKGSSESTRGGSDPNGRLARTIGRYASAFTDTRDDEAQTSAEARADAAVAEDQDAGVIAAVAG